MELLNHVTKNPTAVQYHMSILITSINVFNEIQRGFRRTFSCSDHSNSWLNKSCNFLMWSAYIDNQYMNIVVTHGDGDTCGDAPDGKKCFHLSQHVRIVYMVPIIIARCFVWLTQQLVDAYWNIIIERGDWCRLKCKYPFRISKHSKYQSQNWPSLLFVITLVFWCATCLLDTLFYYSLKNTKQMHTQNHVIVWYIRWLLATWFAHKI